MSDNVDALTADEKTAIRVLGAYEDKGGGARGMPTQEFGPHIDKSWKVLGRLRIKGLISVRQIDGAEFEGLWPYDDDDDPRLYCDGVEYGMWFCKLTPTGREIYTWSLSKKEPQKKRPTQKEMKTRNRAIVAFIDEFEQRYDRLPYVHEVEAETSYKRKQIYSSNPYKEGRIAKKSTKAIPGTDSGTIVKTEQWTATSEEQSRRARRTRSEQHKLECLIDEQERDEKANRIPSEKRRQ